MQHFYYFNQFRKLCVGCYRSKAHSVCGETGETGGRARRGFKRGGRNAERGILFCAEGQRAKPAKLAQQAKVIVRFSSESGFQPRSCSFYDLKDFNGLNDLNDL